MQEFLKNNYLYKKTSNNIAGNTYFWLVGALLTRSSVSIHLEARGCHQGQQGQPQFFFFSFEVAAALCTQLVFTTFITSLNLKFCQKANTVDSYQASTYTTIKRLIRNTASSLLSCSGLWSLWFQLSAKHRYVTSVLTHKKLSRNNFNLKTIQGKNK